MNRSEANQILNEIKHGIWHPTEIVTKALIATGDISIPSEPLCGYGKESRFYRTRSNDGKTSDGRTIGTFQGLGERYQNNIGEAK